MCSGNGERAVHVAMTRDGAVHAINTGFKVDGAFIDCALFSDGQFEIADYFVVLKYNQNMLHAVIVGKKDFDVAGSSGVFGGVPANCGDSLDNKTGIGGHDVSRSA